MMETGNVSFYCSEAADPALRAMLIVELAPEQQSFVQPGVWEWFR